MISKFDVLCDVLGNVGFSCRRASGRYVRCCEVGSLY